VVRGEHLSATRHDTARRAHGPNGLPVYRRSSPGTHRRFALTRMNLGYRMWHAKEHEITRTPVRTRDVSDRISEKKPVWSQKNRLARLKFKWCTPSSAFCFEQFVGRQPTRVKMTATCNKVWSRSMSCWRLNGLKRSKITRWHVNKRMKIAISKCSQNSLYLTTLDRGLRLILILMNFAQFKMSLVQCWLSIRLYKRWNVHSLMMFNYTFEFFSYTINSLNIRRQRR
jgi:hypothetical protein